jgi:hypothetical protein
MHGEKPDITDSRSVGVSVMDFGGYGNGEFAVDHGIQPPGFFQPEEFRGDSLV